MLHAMQRVRFLRTAEKFRISLVATRKGPASVRRASVLSSVPSPNNRQSSLARASPRFASSSSSSPGASSVDGSYFSANLPKLDHLSDKTTAAEAYQRTRAGAEDFEENWRLAQRVAEGSAAAEQPDAGTDHTRPSPASLRSKAAQANRANAELSLDEDGCGSEREPRQPAYSFGANAKDASMPGLGYRDLIMRCTTLNADGDIQKHSEPVVKSALCMNHNLQVSRRADRLPARRPLIGCARTTPFSHAIYGRSTRAFQMLFLRCEIKR